MSANTVRVSALQMCSTADRERNFAIARELISEAADEGAEIVALPENFSFVGEGDAKLAAAEDAGDGPGINFLREAAIKHSVDLIGGTVPVRTASNKVTNTCYVVSLSGDVLARYDKIHLFDVAISDENTYRESEFVTPGDQVVTLDLRGTKVGLTICYDVRFPELYRRLAIAGARVIFVPSAFTSETGKAHWKILLRARAIENLCYIVAPAQYGRHTKRRVSFGNSMIVGPWGEVLASVADGDAVLTAELSETDVDEARRRLPALRHVRLKP